ncbi:hypothetical protein Poli38472_003581 [Pythium oligandrum]|uniref:WRKY transcription factor 19 n=1 Tax=Pythium oligandrum TaxID=41045 RepID=A0A8K1CNE3_PYTOL|nr:hypothetical protein Poli38472_003581 [Pythium oligandrum]|eukprot:TMW65816.1 hypothetical protein Poli38472_003581 [Pythium oligandrum]
MDVAPCDDDGQVVTPTVVLPLKDGSEDVPERSDDATSTESAPSAKDDDDVSSDSGEVTRSTEENQEEEPEREPSPSPSLALVCEAIERKQETQTRPTKNEHDDDVLPPVYGEARTWEVSELFLNPNLSHKRATDVFKKDPFCIPRASDNVGEYRPRFNPLSILVSEEKLLPRNFAIDFSEGIPGTEEASSFLSRKIPPIRPSQTFTRTSSMLMGSLPRQAPTPSSTVAPPSNPFGEPLMEIVASDPPTSVGVSSGVSPVVTTTEQVATHPSSESRPSVSSVPTFGSELAALSEAATVPLVTSMAMPTTSSMPHNSEMAMSGGPQGPFMQRLGVSVPPQGHQHPHEMMMMSPLANYLGQTSISEQHAMPHYAQYPPPQVQQPPATAYGMPHEYSGVMYEHPPPPPSVASSTSTSVPTTPTASQSLQPIPKKPRAKNAFRPCTTPGCTKGARGKSGLCQKHGGGKRCATPNCPKGAQGSSKFCLFHGGGYRCTVSGCTTGARGTSGLCAKHGGYKRARGDGEEPNGASKHPRTEEFEGRAIEDVEI